MKEIMLNEIILKTGRSYHQSWPALSSLPLHQVHQWWIQQHLVFLWYGVISAN